MKILHYITFFSKPSETFIYDQINNLEDKGVDNHLLIKKRELKKERPFDESKIHFLKIRKIFFVNKLLSKIFSGYKYRPKDPGAMMDAVKKINPDILHAHFGGNGVPLKKLLEEYDSGIPLVISFHGTDIISDPELDPVYREEIKKLKDYEKLICTAPSEFLKNKLIENGVPEEKINIVPNTFNKEFLRHRKKQLFQAGNELKIINVSRFIEWKGHKYLLEALRKLTNQGYNNIRLTLVGDGDNKKEMEDLAKRLGVREKVNFTGRVDHKKIPGLLQEHDVYIQPSIKDENTYQEESFGVVVIEAIATGLPVIVTRTGGLPEAVVKEDKQFSFIVPEKDPEAISGILKDMISGDYQFQNNSAYAEKVTDKFSSEKQVESLLQTYKQLQ
ncbi:MAG: glycosyltransferase family 4 protein [Patescibacteria group bacterium]